MFREKKELLKTEEIANKNKAPHPYPQRVDLFNDVRIQPSSYKTPRRSDYITPVIQKVEWRSSSLQHESKNAIVPANITKKIHHTLPQHKIKEFCNMINFQDKIRILQILGRELDGIQFQGDTIKFTTRTGSIILATQTEPSNSNEEKVLNEKVLATLLSLRSNLTIGPNKRLDDPKDNLDPNTDEQGNLDQISAIYQTIYSQIDECTATIQKQENAIAEIDKQKEPYAKQEEDAEFYHHREMIMKRYWENIQALINFIIDNLILAEQTLADMQGHNINETELRPYNPDNWLLDPQSNPPAYHKRGYAPRRNVRTRPPKKQAEPN